MDCTFEKKTFPISQSYSSANITYKLCLLVHHNKLCDIWFESLRGTRPFHPKCCRYKPSTQHSKVEVVSCLTTVRDNKCFTFENQVLRHVFLHLAITNLYFWRLSSNTSHCVGGNRKRTLPHMYAPRKSRFHSQSPMRGTQTLTRVPGPWHQGEHFHWRRVVQLGRGLRKLLGLLHFPSSFVAFFHKLEHQISQARTPNFTS